METVVVTNCMVLFCIEGEGIGQPCNVGSDAVVHKNIKCSMPTIQAALELGVL